MEKSAKIKTRIKFSALDLKAEIAAIAKTVKECKINSIYTIDNNTYLLKIGKTGVRANLVLQSGVKIHLVDTFLEKNEKPNGFTNKLRKHLKSLFIKDIEQIGSERVCKITIGGVDDDNKKYSYFLFIELYAKGNIIFTDADLKIFTLLRPHTYSETEKCLPNEIYPVQQAAKIDVEKITLSPNNLNSEIVTPKSTNLSLISRLVPCTHQSLSEISLLKNNLKPGEKYDQKNATILLNTAINLIEIYKIPDLTTGFLYFEKGKKYSFELSPIPLDFVT